MLPVMLLDQLSASNSVQWRPLLKIRTQIKHARAVLLLKINRMEFQLFDFDVHRDTPRPQLDTAKERGSTLRGVTLQGANVKDKGHGRGVSRSAALFSKGGCWMSNVTSLRVTIGLAL
jgi:hypothetical protein